MNQKGKTRVLFFCFGDSIHARRRIGIFTADPSFEVGVISSFAYDFNNAQNYDLSSAIKKSPVKNRISYLLSKLINIVVLLPVQKTLSLLGLNININECSIQLRDAIRVMRYARQFRPDVIFLQTLLYPSYLSFFLNKNIPTIITFWNGDLTWWAMWTGIERAFKKRIISYGVRRASAITVNSKIARSICLDYGVPSKRISLIRYPGVNLDVFKPRTEAIAAREHLNLRHKKIVLCPRGLGDYLNSDVIIEAAADVLKHHSDTLFLFLSGVGSGSVWENHKKRADELGMSANIRRDGQVPWEKMPLYYHASDVVISVSSNDSLPNCMLEAMACGVPVIMGDIPQIREWITDGDNGFLVPPRDSALLAQRIIETLNNPDDMVLKSARINIEMIRREFDSTMLADTVKRLVKNVVNQHQIIN